MVCALQDSQMYGNAFGERSFDFWNFQNWIPANGIRRKSFRIIFHWAESVDATRLCCRMRNAKCKRMKIQMKWTRIYADCCQSLLLISLMWLLFEFGISQSGRITWSCKSKRAATQQLFAQKMSLNSLSIHHPTDWAIRKGCVWARPRRTFFFGVVISIRNGMKQWMSRFQSSDQIGGFSIDSTH